MWFSRKKGHGASLKHTRRLTFDQLEDRTLLSITSSADPSVVSVDCGVLTANYIPVDNLNIASDTTVNLTPLSGNPAEDLSIKNAVNNGSLNITGGNKNIGTISGAGNTAVSNGASLTVTSISQNTLTIGAGATLTIAALPGGLSGDDTYTPSPDDLSAVMDGGTLYCNSGDALPHIYAENGANVNSPDSEIITVQGLTVTATVLSDTQTFLTWTNDASDVSCYNIQRSTDGSAWTPVATVGSTVNTYADSGLTEGTTYYYRLQSVNGSGSVYSTTTASTMLAAPTGLQATITNGHKVNLQWQDNSAKESGYSIQQFIDGDWQEIAWTAPSATNQTVTGSFDPSATYKFLVQAFSDSNASQPSSAITTTTAAWPDAPSNLSATVISGTEIDLSWTASAGATGYIIEDRFVIDGGGTVIGTVNADQTTFAATGLYPGGIDYFFLVSATNAAGISGYSNISYAQTQNQAPVITNLWAGNPVTSTGTTIFVTANDDGGTYYLKYKWSITLAPSGGFAYFDYREDDIYSPYGPAAVVGFSAPGTYEFCVTVEDAHGLSVTSDPLEITVVQTLTSIMVTPHYTAVFSGQTQQFAATALDQFDNEMAIQPTFTWSVTSNALGTVSSSGLYTAPDNPQSGDWGSVRASANGIFGSGDIHVSPGLLNLTVCDCSDPAKYFSLEYSSYPYTCGYDIGAYNNGAAYVDIKVDSYLSSANGHLWLMVQRSDGLVIINQNLSLCETWTDLCLQTTSNARDFTFTEWYDANNNGQLDYYEYINSLLAIVHVFGLDSLMVSEHGNSSNSATSTDAEIKDLNVGEDIEGNLPIDFAVGDGVFPGYNLNGLLVWEKSIHWMIEQNGNKLAGGDLTDSENVPYTNTYKIVDQILKPSAASGDFVLTAWIDKNQNGQIDANEQKIQVNIHDTSMAFIYPFARIDGTPKPDKPTVVSSVVIDNNNQLKITVNKGEGYASLAGSYDNLLSNMQGKTGDKDSGQVAILCEKTKGGAVCSGGTLTNAIQIPKEGRRPFAATWQGNADQVSWSIAIPADAGYVKIVLLYTDILEGNFMSNEFAGRGDMPAILASWEGTKDANGNWTFTMITSDVDIVKNNTASQDGKPSDAEKKTITNAIGGILNAMGFDLIERPKEDKKHYRQPTYNSGYDIWPKP